MATCRMLMLLIAIMVCIIVVGRVASQSPKFPALIAFGDSHVDSGNNDYINTISKSDFLPYGRDFEGGKPTGRFSNGKIPTDQIAEALGIKQLVPPYLDPSLQINDLLTGVSFASGGSGYDPLSAKILGVLNLADEVRLFKEYKGKLRASVGENTTESIVSGSLYLISSGSNDITNAYVLRRHSYDIDSYADLLVGSASTFFQDLYNLGARNIGILGAPPAGCLPLSRTLAGGPSRQCVGEYNRLASIFNSKLKNTIQHLNSILPGSNLAYFDFYSLVLDLINHPANEGFEVVDKGCCGTGLVETLVLCTRLDPGTCANASTYVFWDSIHLSQHGYELLVRPIIDNYK